MEFGLLARHRNYTNYKTNDLRMFAAKIVSPLSFLSPSKQHSGMMAETGGRLTRCDPASGSALQTGVGMSTKRPPRAAVVIKYSQTSSPLTFAKARVAFAATSRKALSSSMASLATMGTAAPSKSCSACFDFSHEAMDSKVSHILIRMRLVSSMKSPTQRCSLHRQYLPE